MISREFPKGGDCRPSVKSDPHIPERLQEPLLRACQYGLQGLAEAVAPVPSESAGEPNGSLRRSFCGAQNLRPGLM